VRGRRLGRKELDEIEDLEAVRAQEPHPVAVAELELDLEVGLAPLEPVQPELGSLQRLGRRPLASRTQHGQGRVPQEDQLAARTQQPRRLRDPLVRVTPNRGAVLGMDEVERRVSSAFASISSRPSLNSSFIRLAVASCAGVTSTPTTRAAPRFFNQALKYAVPQPSSTMSLPLRSGSTWTSASRAAAMPQVISSSDHASCAFRSVYSAFALVQLSRLTTA